MFVVEGCKLWWGLLLLAGFLTEQASLSAVATHG